MPEPTRVLVTGAAGQLGGELLALPWPDPFKVVGRTRGDLDISDRDAVWSAIDGGGYDIVVNAAAYTAVDRAESEIEAARAVNETGVGYLAEACAQSGAAMIHVSTDYVFDGTKELPYVENDEVRPLGAYGRSKAAGEEALRRALVEHVILRTAWVYSARGANFVKTVLRLMAERDELRIVADQRGTPTSAKDLARAIAEIARQLTGDDPAGGASPWGTYHCVNGGATTWHGFATEIVERAGPRLGRSPRVVPIATADYPTPARRPANSRLACAKLERRFGLVMRPWREALREVLDEVLRQEIHVSAEGQEA